MPRCSRPGLTSTPCSTGHREDILAFGITRIPLRPVIASVGDMGARVPIWDIAENFGADTDLRVSDSERARDLARSLGRHRVCLLRGMGFVATGRGLNDVVRMSVYLARNAQALAVSMRLGAVRGISQGESEARLAIDPESNAMRRGMGVLGEGSGLRTMVDALSSVVRPSGTDCRRRVRRSGCDSWETGDVVWRSGCGLLEVRPAVLGLCDFVGRTGGGRSGGRFLQRQDRIADRGLSAGRRLRHLCAHAGAPLSAVSFPANRRWSHRTCRAPAR